MVKVVLIDSRRQRSGRMPRALIAPGFRVMAVLRDNSDPATHQGGPGGRRMLSPHVTTVARVGGSARHLGIALIAHHDHRLGKTLTECRQMLQGIARR